MIRRIVLGVLALSAAACDLPALPGARGAPLSPAGGVAGLPAVPQPHGAGEIVGFVLQGTGPDQPPRDVTFGQVFRPGQVPAPARLAAVIDGHPAPAQLDVRTRYPDGSARLAAVTVRAPALAAGRSVDGMLTIAPADAGSGGPERAGPPEGYDLRVDLRLHDAAGGEGAAYRLDAGALLRQAIAAGRAGAWLRGPEASEWRVDAPVEGALHVTFDIRVHADGSTRTDVQVRNDLAMQKTGGEARYDIVITQAGRPVLARQALQQFQYQTWHRAIWSPASPAVNVVHDIAALERTGAIPTYDLTTGVDARLIARQTAAMSGETDRILGPASVTRYMPTTGGRADIGPQPQWNAVWLMTQQPQARDFALAQADAAGSVPWHFFDPGTGDFVRVTDYPRLWTDDRGGSDSNSTGLPQKVAGYDRTGWAPDPGHQPDLSYVPYLLTADRYRLDELNAQASWTILAIWPLPRLNGEGLVCNGAQVRQQAWTLRQIIEAAFTNPDGSAAKSYFAGILDNNIRCLLARAKTASQGEAAGWIQGAYGSTRSVMAPWQQDYFASSIILAARLGIPGALDVLRWESSFLAGRFLAADKGFDPHDGAAYNLDVATQAGVPLQSWAEIGAATRAANHAGNGTWAKTFTTDLHLARASLAGLIGLTDAADARKAYAWLEANAPAGTFSATTLRAAPTFNIVRQQP